MTSARAQQAASRAPLRLDRQWTWSDAAGPFPSPAGVSFRPSADGECVLAPAAGRIACLEIESMALPLSGAHGQFFRVSQSDPGLQQMVEEGTGNV